MNGERDFAAELRASLTAQAEHAPGGAGLAERIIEEVDRRALPTPIHRPRRHRLQGRWLPPLISAVAAAAVAAVVVGLANSNLGAAPRPVAPLKSGGTSQSTGPAPASSTPIRPAPSTGPSTTVNVPPPPSAPGLTDFRAISLTFASAANGWALGTANCLNAPIRSCPSVLRTTDGGASWRSMKQPMGASVPRLGCTASCIDSIRFATSHIGYAFGPTGFFMTDDGGASWQRHNGGAAALETLDNNVIRVNTTQPGCTPPGCGYAVQIAPVGSTNWQDVSLGVPSVSMATGVSLTRTGSAAFLEIFGHPAGGAQSAVSALYASGNDGRSWTNLGEPCPRIGAGAAGAEVDSTMLTSAADGSATVLCVPRGNGGTGFTSTLAAASQAFQPGTVSALSRAGAHVITAMATPTAKIIVAADSAAMYRSTDGGNTFSKLPAASAPAAVQWIGFESATDGRALSENGGTLWSTRDAGLIWSSQALR